MSNSLALKRTGTSARGAGTRRQVSVQNTAGDTKWLGSGLRLKFDQSQKGAPVRSFSAGFKIVLLILAVGGGAVLLPSIHRVTVLRKEPPPEFLKVSGSSRADEVLATRYWTVLTELQERYYRGANLPEQPPPGFRLTAADYPSSTSAPAMHAAYWHEVRRIWLDPDYWETRYEIDFDWLVKAAREFRG